MKKVVLVAILAVFSFGGSFESGFKEFINGNLNQSSEFFEISCQKEQNSAGCFMLGSVLENLDDLKSALSAHLKACDMGDMQGCDSVGRFYIGYKTAEISDEKMAIQYFQKACLGGFASSCIYVGEHYEIGEKVDFKQAEHYYKIGCDGKNGYSCYAFANLYDTSKLNGADDSMLMRYYGLGCDYGDDTSCREFRNKFKKIYKDR